MPTLPAVPAVSAGNTAFPSPRDARMLAQQQVRLLGGMSRLLSRLLRGLLWQELTAGERRRCLALLARLDSDLALALAIARGTRREARLRARCRPPERSWQAQRRPPFPPEKAARVPSAGKRGQEARPKGPARAAPPRQDGTTSVMPASGSVTPSCLFATAPISFFPMPIPSEDRPFTLHLLRLEQTPGGRFVPGAQVAFTPALRASGLLLSLPGEDLKRLLLVLTFVHPNGHIQPTLLELSQALRQPQAMTRAQMRRLERFVWQGKPLLHEVRRDSGLHGWTPSPRILGMEHAPQETPPTSDAPVYVAAGREAVIAHSRATYARPRAEVEREMALANGWEWPPRTLGERQDELRQKAQGAEDSATPSANGRNLLQTRLTPLP